MSETDEKLELIKHINALTSYVRNPDKPTDHSRNRIPANLDEYNEYMKKVTSFIKSRNKRIQEIGK